MFGATLRQQCCNELAAAKRTAKDGEQGARDDTPEYVAHDQRARTLPVVLANATIRRLGGMAACASLAAAEAKSPVAYSSSRRTRRCSLVQPEGPAAAPRRARPKLSTNIWRRWRASGGILHGIVRHGISESQRLRRTHAAAPFMLSLLTRKPARHAC